MKQNLVVLPTAQWEKENPWLPNERGILRLEAAARKLVELPEAMLMIAGGYVNPRGYSLADRMAVCFAERHPDLVCRMVLVYGRANRTIIDMRDGLAELAKLWQHLPHETVIHFASERIHYERTKQTLAVLGYDSTHVDSGADTSLYSNKDIEMAQETDMGKILALGKSAQEWNQKANAAASAHCEECNEWAKENGDLDSAEFQRIYNSMAKLKKATLVTFF